MRRVVQCRVRRHPVGKSRASLLAFGRHGLRSPGPGSLGGGGGNKSIRWTDSPVAVGRKEGAQQRGLARQKPDARGVWRSPEGHAE